MTVFNFRHLSATVVCLLATATLGAAAQAISHRHATDASSTILRVNKFARVTSLPASGKAAKAETAATGIPAAPTVTKMQETSTPGTVQIQWAAPDTDANGNSINPAELTYRITTGTKSHETTVADNLTATSATLKAHEPDKQDFAFFTIYAKNSSGESQGVMTPIIPVGPADESPYAESFRNGALSHNWAVNITDNADNSEWTLYTDIDVEDLVSQDGDNGFIGAATLAGGGVTSCIKAGKIKVNASAATLVFFVYNIVNTRNPDALNTNTVDVVINGDHVTTKHLVISDFKTEGWHKVAIPLKDYVGQVITFNVLTTFNYYTNTFFDNFQLVDFADPDLKAENITLTGKTVVDSEFKIRVMTKNIGLSDAKDYFVDLYLNGDLIGSKAGKPISAEKCDTVKFTQVLPITSAKDNYYYAKIRYADDRNPANNVTDTLRVTLDLPDYPTPLNLRGSRDADNAVTLSWDTPDLSTAVPDETTESFEDYTAWQHEQVGGWTFIDGDNHPIGSFSNFSIPGINGTKQSFWICDDRYPKFSNPAFYARTGDKYLAQFFCTEKVQCDDWAVSPKLYGGAQKIRFYARSFSDKYLETMEVLCSYGSAAATNTASFQSVKKVNAVPAAWTEYTVELPEGASHFALRCTSTDKLMLMIDDVSFVPQGASSSLSLKGYNVYRDDVMLNSSLIIDTATSFTDTTAGPDQHKYVVTAIYDRGESCPSNVCHIAPAAVSSVSAAHAVVTAIKGGIKVSHADGLIRVFTTTGNCITQRPAAEAVSISLPEGIYLVEAGTQVTKVIVR